MKSNSLAKSIVLLALAVLVSCDKQEDFVDPEGYEGVDSRLWYFLNAFEEEANSRGISVDLRALGLTGRIANIEGLSIAGGCNFHGSAANEIILDTIFWNALTFIQREMIVFHELGHCVLYREHREATDVTGMCVSIMRSGSESCRDGYSEVTREVYLDELFNPAFANEITP